MWDINFFLENCGDFIVLPSMAVQSLMFKLQLRVGHLLKRSKVRVENYLPLGVISHPNRQIL